MIDFFKGSTSIHNDWLPVSAIEDGYVRVGSGEHSYLIYLFTPTIEDDTEIMPIFHKERMASGFRKYFEEENKGKGFFLSIFTHKEDEFFTRNATKDVGNAALNAMAKARVTQLKEARRMTIVYGVHESSYTPYFQKLMKHYQCRPLRTGEITSLLWNITNPSYSSGFGQGKTVPSNVAKGLSPNLAKLKPKDPIIKAFPIDSGISSKDDFKIGNTYIKTWSMNTAPSTPESYMSVIIPQMATFPADSVLRFSFIVASEGYEKLLKSRAESVKAALPSIIDPKNRIIGESIEALFEELTREHQVLTSITASYAVYGTKEVVDSISSPPNSSSTGVIWEVGWYKAPHLWFSSFPGIVVNPPEDRLPLKSSQSAFLATVGYRGRPSDFCAFTDVNGFFTGFEFFSAKRRTNGGAITAPTGVGKSTLMNFILTVFYWQSLNKGHYPLGLLVDLGGSYKPFADALNKYLPDGKKIVYRALKPTEFYNPFDLDFGEEITDSAIERKVNLVSQFLNIALGDLTDREQSILTTMISSSYRVTLKEKPNLIPGTMETYISKYNDSGFSDADSFLSAMPTMSTMLTMIQLPEIRNAYPKNDIESLSRKIVDFLGTTHGRPFSSKSSALLLGDMVIAEFDNVFSFEGSKLAPLLLSYLIASRYQFFIKHPVEVPKIILIEEYPQFKKINPEIDQLADFIYKTVRKKGCTPYLIAQNIEAIPKDVVTNSGNIISLITSKKEEQATLARYLGEPDEFVTEPMSKMSMVKGEFSDFLVTDMGGGGITQRVLRMAFSAEELKYYTPQPPMLKKVEDD